MTRSILRSSTALALSLALAVPGPLAAQGAASEETCAPARLGASEDKRALNRMLKACREAGLIEPSQAKALRAQLDAGEGAGIVLAQAETEQPGEEAAPDGEAAEDPALLLEGEGGGEAAPEEPAEEPAAEAVEEPAAEEPAVEPVEEPAAEEPAEEPAAADQAEAAEEPAEEAAPAEEEAGEPEIAIEGDGASTLEDGEATMDLDAAEEPDDGGIVVDQAPEAEVEEGLATEDSVEAPSDAGDAPDAEGAPLAEGGEAVIDLGEAEDGDDGGIVVDQAPQAEVEEGLAAEDSVQSEEASDAEPAADDAEAPGTDEAAPRDQAEGEAEASSDDADELGAALEDAARAGEEAEAEPTPEDEGAAVEDEAQADVEAEPEAEDEAQAESDAGAGLEDALEDAARAEDGAEAAEGDEAASEDEAAAEKADDAGDLESALEEAARAEDDAEGADEAEMEVPQEDTEETAARANEAPSAAAATADAREAEAQATETETLTEADTRSSGEAFAEGDDGGGGLSTFEKALLLGLGAATVGAVLNNGGRVVENTGDRVVVEREGTLRVLKDDDELLRRPGATVSQQTYDDGSTLTVVDREDGSRVTTIRAASGQVLRRTRTLPDGTEVTLFDDTGEVAPVDVAELRNYEARSFAAQDTGDLRAALAGAGASGLDRSFSLQQIREIRAVRDLMPQVDLAAVEFDTGSAVIRPSEAEDLRDIGEALASLISENPDEVFLVEGHTDAVGSAASNLALSDRRAESVALALTEYFDVPPESMIAQGYGESNLKVQTSEAARENRRATVRRITPLLQGAALQ